MRRSASLYFFWRQIIGGILCKTRSRISREMRSRASVAGLFHQQYGLYSSELAATASGATEDDRTLPKVTNEGWKMQKLLVTGLFSLAFLTPSLAEQPIKVTGCVEKAVEAGCLVLRTKTFQPYSISAAQPKPTPGTYGEVIGIIKFGAITSCMQGEVIDPAKWIMKSKSCPKEGAAK